MMSYEFLRNQTSFDYGGRTWIPVQIRQEDNPFHGNKMVMIAVKLIDVKPKEQEAMTTAEKPTNFLTTYEMPGRNPVIYSVHDTKEEAINFANKHLQSGAITGTGVVPVTRLVIFQAVTEVMFPPKQIQINDLTAVTGTNRGETK